MNKYFNRAPAHKKILKKQQPTTKKNNYNILQQKITNTVRRI